MEPAKVSVPPAGWELRGSAGVLQEQEGTPCKRVGFQLHPAQGMPGARSEIHRPPFSSSSAWRRFPLTRTLRTFLFPQTNFRECLCSNLSLILLIQSAGLIPLQEAVNPKGKQSWIFFQRTDAEAETPILWPPDVKSYHWKRPWCWERFKVGREGDDTGWDGWMASQTQWTWVWASSGSWWWTRRPGLLQSMGSQRVGHDWVTEITDWYNALIILY